MSLVGCCCTEESVLFLSALIKLLWTASPSGCLWRTDSTGHLQPQHVFILLSEQLSNSNRQYVDTEDKSLNNTSITEYRTGNYQCMHIHSGVQNRTKAKTKATCDGLLKLLVRFAQDADELHHSTGIYKCRLVVSVLVDEVPHGASGVTLHVLVVTGEKPNQSWNAMQGTDLRERGSGTTHTTHC